jgi:DNA-directed RNA polymerase specialized sigma24 family protein
MRAQTDGDRQREAQLQRSVTEAASLAIGAGVSLTAIADAERIGQRPVREEMGREVLRAVERAAGRKREADHEYERAVVRAGRLGLAYRDVAAAAQVAPGTVRATLARTQTASGNGAAATATGAIIEADAEQQSAQAS